MEHIEALLAPIAADNRCGDPIRYSPAFDRLVAARQQDDETLPTGVWQSTPRPPPSARWSKRSKRACRRWGTLRRKRRRRW